MARKRKQERFGFVLSESVERKNLEKLVAVLNDYTGPEDDWNLVKLNDYTHKDAEQLRRMMLAWRVAREEIEAAISQGTAIYSLVTKMKLAPEDRTALQTFVSNIQHYSDSSGRLRVIEPYGPACSLFVRFLNSSEGLGFLGGPCLNITYGKPCNKWFVKDKRSDKTYCSRKCAANAAKTKERERTYQRKIKQAHEAIKDYPTRAACWSDLDWKSYAVAAKYGVSKKFLTDAVKAGALVAPEEAPRLLAAHFRGVRKGQKFLP